VRRTWLATLALGGAAVPTAGCPAQARPPEERSILQSPGPQVELRLLDAWTGMPIADAAVRVASDNGIRCVTTPCPTDRATWSGRSDPRGAVLLDKSALRAITHLETDRHDPVDLGREAVRDGSAWTIELMPRDLTGQGPVGTRGYKLIDGRSGRPLANRNVRLEFPSGAPLDATTNPLGYVFFPFERSFGAGEPTAWVSSAGFRRARLDFGAGAHGTWMRVR